MKLRYIGPREPYYDVLHHTNQVWEVRGDVREVADDVGRKMVNCHPDLFEEAKPALQSKKHEHVQQIAAKYGVVQQEPFEQVIIERRSGVKAPVAEATRADLVGVMDRLGMKTSSAMTKQDAFQALSEYYRLHGSLTVPKPPSFAVLDSGPVEPDAHERQMSAGAAAGAAPAEGEKGVESDLHPGDTPEREAAVRSVQPPPASPPESAEMPIMGMADKMLGEDVSPFDDRDPDDSDNAF